MQQLCAAKETPVFSSLFALAFPRGEQPEVSNNAKRCIEPGQQA